MLEAAIDVRNAKLQPLESFVLPGGTSASAWLHMARVVCRRAEIDVARLAESGGAAVSDHVLPYLNRLSDLLFVMGRSANKQGRGDVLWVPGAGQDARPRKTRRAPARSGGSRAVARSANPRRKKDVRKDRKSQR